MRKILALAVVFLFMTAPQIEAARRRARAASSVKSARAAGSAKSSKRAGKKSAGSSTGANAGAAESVSGEAAGASLPVGSVIVWSSSKPPNGWIWADGSPLSADAKYSRLRDLIGEKAPDMRGAFADKQPFSLNYIIKY